MYEGAKIGVVIPAYNEEGFVGEVIETVPEFVDRVYAIDDRSTDGTWAEIREHAEAVNARARESADDGTSDECESVSATPAADGGTGAGTTDGRRVVPIRHEENTGVGGAITTGYEYALADDMDVTAVMNGDGQMDPAVLDQIIDPVVDGEAAYAKGNRLTSLSDCRGMSAWRLFGNLCLTLMTKVASGYWHVTDPQNGYTAISKEALETIDLSSLYEGYGFCNDLLVTLSAYGFRVVDVDHQAVYGDEQSSIRYSRFIPTLILLLSEAFLWRMRIQYLGDPAEGERR